MQFHPELPELLRKYFTFSRREYKATLALFLITIAVWCYPDIHLKVFSPKYNQEQLLAKAYELDALLLSNESSNSEFNPPLHDTSIANHNIELFSFNPNTISLDDFLKLGFSEKQIHTIQNYIAKVGEIKSKADFKKIYGISSTQFTQLEPYIDLPETRESVSKSGSHHKINSIEGRHIEINTADSLALDELPGIGMGYARRIIKYRNSLGGFVNLNQLMEVYGFRTGLLDSIRPYLTLDPSKVIKLPLNTATIDQLKIHPYLRYKLANAIVNYRTQHGNYKSIDDLKNILIMTDEVFEKIKSYIYID